MRTLLYLDALEERALPSTTIPLNGFSWTSVGPDTIAEPALIVQPGPGGGGPGGGGGGGGGFQFSGDEGAASGEITAIAPDPSDVNHIYIGTGGGGVFSILFDPTDPTGQKYTATSLTDNITDAQGRPIGGLGYIGSLTLDPDDPLTVYAGTGEANYMADSYAGKGILKSTDGGQHWTLLQGNPGRKEFNGYSIAKVIVDWQDSNTLFAAVTHGALGADLTLPTGGNCGIWRSFDGGLSWTDLTALDPTLMNADKLAFTDAIIDPQSENLIIAVGEPSGDALNGVYISTNATDPSPGVLPTFTPAVGLPSGAGLGRISLGSGWRAVSTRDWASLADTNGHLVMLAQVQNGAGANGQTAWTDITPTLQNGNGKNNPLISHTNYLDVHIQNAIVNIGGIGAGNYTNTLAVDPNNNDFVSLGGGSNFVRVAVPPNAAIEFVDNDVLQVWYYQGINVPNMNWVAIPDVNTTGGFGPGPGGGGGIGFQVPPFDSLRSVGDYSHALAYDHFGNLYDATDTGLWRYSQAFTTWDATNSTPRSQGIWTNLNLNLPISQFNNVSLVPDSNDTFVGGVRGVVNAQFVDGTGWTNGNAVEGGPAFFQFGGGFLNYDGSGRAIIDPRPTPDPINPSQFVFGQDIYVASTYTLNNTKGIAFYRSQDGGQTFSNQSQGLGLSDARDPSVPMVLDLPAQSTLTSAPDASVGTVTVVSAIGFPTPTPTAPLFVQVDSEIMQVLAVSGTTFTVLRGMQGTAAAAHTAGAQITVARPARLLMGSDRLYVNYSPESTNNSFTVLNYSVPLSFFPGNQNTGGNILSIGAAQSDENTIYLGVGTTLQATSDNGVTWSDITPAGVSASAAFTGIAVDPSDPKTAYAVSPNGGAGRIWVTHDRATWTEISNNLPATVNPWSVTFIPVSQLPPGLPNGVLLVGTDAGIYDSLDLGLTWNLLGAGMPNVQVRDMQYNAQLDTLAAATYGRGVWEINLQGGSSGPPLIIAPAAQVLNEDTTLPFTSGLSISDPAVGNTNDIQVTLTVGAGAQPSGTLAINPLGLSADPANTATHLIFTGTIPAINAALSTLVYTPVPGFSGTDTLTIDTDDLAHTGGILSVKQTSTRTITLTVNPITLTLQPSPVNTSAGTTLPAVTVNVLDAQGALVPDPIVITMTATSSAGPAQLLGTATVTTLGGSAVFSNLALPTAATGYRLTASAPGSVAPLAAPSASSTPFDVSPGPPANIAFETNPPTAVVGVALPPFNVDYVDQFGNLVTSASTQVTISAVGPGPLNGSSVTAQTVNGVAAFSGLVLQTAGSYTLLATTPAGQSTNSAPFMVIANQDFALAFVPATVPAAAISGQPMPPIKVNVVDQFNNPSSTSSASVTISVASGPAILSGGGLTVQAVNGVATFTGLVLSTAGTYTLAATAANLTPGVSGPISVAPTAGARLSFETTPGSIPAGTLPAIKVDVLDSLGNLATGSTAQVSIAATGPGTLGGSTTASAVNGVATFSGLVLQTPGTYTLTATAAGVQSASSNSFAITSPPATQLSFAGTVGGTSTGQAIPTFSVKLLDAFGNPVTSSAAPVTIAASGPGIITAGTTTVVASGGVATFSGLVLSAPGFYTLTASSGALPAVTSNAFSVQVPVATGLAFEATPAGATAGQPIPDFKVDVVDQFGFLMAGASAQVTIKANGPGGVGGATTVATTGGVADFSNAIILAAGQYTVTASAAGLSDGTSGSFTVSPGAAVNLIFLANPADTTAGTLPAVQVALLDSFGNPLTGSTAPVTITAAGPGSLDGTTTVNAAAGLATFNDLILGKVGQYTLTASSPGLSSVSTGTFTISVGAPAQLSFASLAASALTAGQSLPAFQVDVTDAFGNLTSSTATITLASGVSSGALRGTLTAQAVNGVANFTGISPLTAGSYSLSASASGLANGQSAALTVKPAPAVKLAFEPFTTILAAGQALTGTKVDLLDAFGNVATGSSATVALTASGPGPLNASSTVAPSVNGVGTFFSLSFTRPGSYTLSATASGLGAATSTPLTVTSGAPASLVWVSSPAGGSAGQALPSLTLEVFDAFGNPVTGNSAPVTLSSSGGGLAGTTSVPIVNGFATFSNLSLTRAGTYTLVANVGGQATVVSMPFVVTGSTASASTSSTPVKVKYLSVPSKATAGRALPLVRVQLLDASGHVVKKAHVLVTLRLKGGKLSGPVQAFTDANGVATFRNLKIAARGRFSLIASAKGARLASGHTITVSVSVQRHV